VPGCVGNGRGEGTDLTYQWQGGEEGRQTRAGRKDIGDQLYLGVVSAGGRG